MCVSVILLNKKYITILGIIQRPFFDLRHDVSKTGFCLRFQMGPTHLGPPNRASNCIGTQGLALAIALKSVGSQALSIGSN
jgi:hypothetical protein